MDGRLDVQGVEAGLQQQEIDTAFDEGLGLLEVCRFHPVETPGPYARVIGIRRQGEGLGCRPHAAGHQYLARGGISRLAGYAGCPECHFGCL